MDKKSKIFCLVYIDNVIWVAPDQTQIDKVLESLKDELEMTVEGDIMAFLGINFKCLPTGAVEILQLGLTEQVLKTMGMQDCNPDCTSASQKWVAGFWWDKGNHHQGERWLA